MPGQRSQIKTVCPGIRDGKPTYNLPWMLEAHCTMNHTKYVKKRKCVAIC